MIRSTSAQVRNPVLALPAMRKIQALPLSSRAILREFLLELRVDAWDRADKAWRSHKAPMACYWKSVAVYAGHTARGLK